MAQYQCGRGKEFYDLAAEGGEAPVRRGPVMTPSERAASPEGKPPLNDRVMHGFNILSNRLQGRHAEAGERKVVPQTYTGSALKPEVTVRLDATILGPDDYTVDYANNVNAGTAQVTVTGAGNYTGSATGTFAVNARDLSGASVSVKSQTYTGTARKPAVTVKLGSATLVSGKDYQVTYTNNVKAGTATAKVMGIGNYAGTKSATFTIARAKQTITLKAKTPRVKASALKKAKRAIAASKAFTLKGCKGTVRYAKAKGSSAKLKINAKTGKITVAKGTKKGVYKIKVKVTSAKTANYLAASKTVTVNVKVV